MENSVSDAVAREGAVGVGAKGFRTVAPENRATDESRRFESGLTRGHPPVRRRRTRLEITLMCLLARGGNTGSGLVRILRECPIGGHGQSPGAVYPALERLEEAEFLHRRVRKSSRRRLCGRSRTGFEGRYFPKKRQREYLLTYRGIAELRRWAREPVTRADMLERPDFLLLKYLMIPGLLGAAASRRFLEQYERTAEEIAGDTRRYFDWFEIDAWGSGRDMSPTVRRAFELTIDVMRTRLRWAEHRDATSTPYRPLRRQWGVGARGSPRRSGLDVTG